MSAYTATQAGDPLSDSTFGGTGHPGIGDTATSAYGLTMASGDWEFGDSPASGGVVLTLNSAFLSVGNGYNVDMRGGADLNNSYIEYPGGGAGGRLRLKNCPDGGAYALNISKAHNQSNAYLYVNGNSATPFTLDFTPAATTGVGYVESGAYIGGGQLRLQYVSMKLGGAAYDIEFYPRNSTVWDYYVKNATLDGGGRFYGTAFMQASSKFTLSHVTMVNTAASYSLYWTAYNAMTTGTRMVDHCDFDKSCTIGSPADTSWYYCIFRGGWYESGSVGAAAWDQFERCIVVQPGNTTPLYITGDITDCYLLGTYTGTNWHSLQTSLAGVSWNLTIDGLIFDGEPSDQSGDMVAMPGVAQTYVRTITVRNCISLKRRSGSGALGILVSCQAPTSGCDVVIEHNSSYQGGSGDNGAILRVGETQIAYAGYVSSCRGNLTVSESAADAVVKYQASPGAADAAITVASHNGAWDIVGDQALTDPYEPADAKFGSTPGTNDVYENPGLSDPTINILSFTGEATVADALDYLVGLGIETGIDTLFSGIRTAWTPSNANYDGAAHDGGTIGAVPYAAPAGNTAPPAPSLTGPADFATVNNSATLTWTQAPDADGDPITHYREHRPAAGGAWTRSGAVFSGHVWDTSGLANGDWDWRIVASDGTDETASTSRTLTVDHTNTPPPAPSWITPASDGLTFDTSVPLAWGAVTDPDGDPVLYRAEYKEAAGSTWLPVFSLQSPLSYSWNTGALANGDYNLRIYANDGQADSTASVVRTVTIAHAATGATSGMTINGFDPIAYGVVLESLEGVAGPPSHELEEQQVAGIPGTTVINRRILSRPVALNYAIVGADEAEVRAKNDLFVSLITEEQPIDLVLLRRSDRKLVLEFLDDPLNAIGPYLGTGEPAGAWRGRLSFAAPQPFWQEITETSVTGVTTTKVALAQGNGPTWIRFKVQGPATNPRVDLYRWDDTLIASMQFSGSLGAGDWYAVDCGLKTAYRNTSGLYTSGTDVLGTELPVPDFFQILREYSRFRSSVFVQIACTAGTLQASWYKRWGSG